MKGTHERTVSSKYSSKSSTASPSRIRGSVCPEAGPSDSKLFKSSSLWPGFLASAFSVFETNGASKGCGKKESHTRSHGWTAAVRRVMSGGSMWRLQERVLGLNKTAVSSSTSDIWLLGVCYKISLEDPTGDPIHTDGYVAFVEDFSSRILMTYRKGFVAIGDSKYTSDVNWGCMLRSSQMLVAQVFCFIFNLFIALPFKSVSDEHMVVAV